MQFYAHVSCDKHKMKFTLPVFVFKFKTFSEMCGEFLWVKSEIFLFYTICEISVKKKLRKLVCYFILQYVVYKKI